MPEAAKWLIFKTADHHLDKLFNWVMPLWRHLGESVLVPAGLPLLGHFLLYKGAGLAVSRRRLTLDPGLSPAVWLPRLWIITPVSPNQIHPPKTKTCHHQGCSEKFIATVQAVPKKGFQKCFQHRHRIWNKRGVSWEKCPVDEKYAHKKKVTSP